MQKTKSILMITSAYPSSCSMDKNFVLPELRALLKAGHRVTLMPLYFSGELDVDCPKEAETLYDLSLRFQPAFISMALVIMFSASFFYRELGCNFIKIISSWTRLLNFIKYSLKAIIVNITLQSRPLEHDIIYTYWCAGETLGVLLFNKGKNRKYFVQSRAHGYDLNEERDCNKGYLPYRSYVIEHIDRLILLSQQAKNYITQKYETNNIEVIVSPMGVHSQYNAVPAKFDEKHISFFSCSYTNPVKRIQLIFDVICDISRANCDKEIIWTHYGALLKDIDFSLYNLPSNLRCYFKGIVKPEIFLKEYKEAITPIFINLSLSEGQPVSIMEAMSCGLPIIATDVGGVAEMVGSEAGLLVPISASAHDIANSVQDFIESKNSYLNASQSALARQRVNYDAERNYLFLARDL